MSMLGIAYDTTPQAVPSRSFDSMATASAKAKRAANELAQVWLPFADNYVIDGESWEMVIGDKVVEVTISQKERGA